MTKNYTCLLGLFLSLVVVSSCKQDNSHIRIKPTEISPVNFDFNSVPYKTLSEYNFFDGNMTDLKPVFGVLPYKIISGLFIDYAKAKTFVWMPKDSKARYVNDYSVFDFPEGAILITTHYFENVLPKNYTKMIETRLLIKKEGEWIMANYKWNEDQTEAFFTKEGSFIGVTWLENNETRTVNYKIPTYDECFTCHNKYDELIPIGPKPQNLNHSISFNDGVKNQLDKWAEFGYLDSNYPSNIDSVINWADNSQPLGMRVRSYLDINCSHCHSDKGYCGYAPLRFAFNKTAEDITNMGVCVNPSFDIDESITQIVAPGEASKSAMLFRISSTLDEVKMPIIGRTLKHEEGALLIKEWINSLEKMCQ